MRLNIGFLLLCIISNSRLALSRIVLFVLKYVDDVFEYWSVLRRVLMPWAQYNADKLVQHVTGISVYPPERQSDAAVLANTDPYNISFTMMVCC